MKAHLASYRLFLAVLGINLLLLLWQPALARHSTVNSLSFLLEVLSIVPPVMILMGLLDVWVPRRLVEAHLGPDAGLLGGLNAAVMNKAMALVDENGGKLVIIGKRGQLYLEQKKMVFANFPGVIDEQRLEQALLLRDYLSSSVLKGQMGKVSVVFPRALSFTSQRIEVVQVLPFIPDAGKQPTNIAISDIVLESDLGNIVEYLIYLWLGQKIFEIFGMSRLAEQAARFMHLENCNERIKDLDKKLRFQYFRTRHEIIDQNMRELFAARLLHE